MNRLTRRAVIAGSVAAPLLKAQTPSATTTADDWGKAAREANQANAEALSKVTLPMTIEPAFAFKA